MAINPELSIIILNYNAKELLANCLNSIKKFESEIPLEVIVSDNASSDGSQDMLKSDFPWVRLLEGENSGFSKGNNRARPYAHGDMILFLNPDTLIHKNVFTKTTNYLKGHKEVGALTCKLVLPDGTPDKDTRRRFPTPWISFKRLIFKNGYRYWYQDVPDNIIQEVDVIQGAFFLTWKKTLDKVGWFDEDYFFQGEDIDLSWKINNLGLKNIYYPEVSVTHLKGASTGKSKHWKARITLKHKIRIKLATVDAMELFFRKRLFNNYPLVFSWFVVLGIKIFKVLRLTGVVISSVIK
jgi:GT2 family glycosyltransferase